MSKHDIDAKVKTVQVRQADSGTYQIFSYAVGAWLEFCPLKELVTLMHVLDAAAGYQDADDVNVPGVGQRDRLLITFNSAKGWQDFTVYTLHKEALNHV